MTFNTKPDEAFKIRIRCTTAVILLFCTAGGLAHAQPTDDEAAGAAAAEADEAPSPLLDEPSTPDELLSATELMVRLGRPQLARRYLEQFVEADPDDDTLLELSDKYGPGLFIKLSNVQSLRPVSTRLLERVTQAFRETGASPERIDGLIERLGNPPRDRELAIRSLKSLGPLAVPRFIVRLSDPQFAEEHDRLIDALSRLGKPAVPPLLAALATPSVKLRSDVAQVLGWIDSPDIVPYLWYPAFSPQEPPEVQVSARHALRRIQERQGASEGNVTLFGVTNVMQKTALKHYRYEFQWPLEEDGTVDFWVWDEAEGNVVRTNPTAQLASLMVGRRFAQQALALAPDRRDLQALYLGLTIAEARHSAGWDVRLPAGPGTAHDLALTSGSEVVAQTLELALESGNPAAAFGALQVLGQIGTGQRTLLSGAMPSPVLAALDFPDKRVQFAAAQCVLQLNPVERFAGSDRIVPVLARALNGSTMPTAVVVDASTRRGNQVAALIGELGFMTATANTGREGFRLAAERGDVELVVLEINTIRWPLSVTVANLRADARTARVPIVVYGPDTMRSRVASLIRRHQPMVYAIEATASEEFGTQLRPHLARWRQGELSEEQRAEQMAAAAYWLADIASSRNDVFDLTAAGDALIEASNDPLLTDNVLLALSEIPTNAVQKTLLQLAISASTEPAISVAAARHLAHHIQAFGLLLTREELARLKSSWRDSSNPELASALATVLGSLKPNAKQVGTRLREFAPRSQVAP